MTSCQKSQSGQSALVRRAPFALIQSTRQVKSQRRSTCTAGASTNNMGRSQAGDVTVARNGSSRTAGWTTAGSGWARAAGCPAVAATRRPGRDTRLSAPASSTRMGCGRSHAPHQPAHLPGMPGSQRRPRQAGSRPCGSSACGRGRRGPAADSTTKARARCSAHPPGEPCRRPPAGRGGPGPLRRSARSGAAEPAGRAVR